MKDIENQIKSHHERNFSPDRLKSIAEKYSRDGYLKFNIGEFIPAELFDCVIDEANTLLNESSIRRDVEVKATSYSKRSMSNVTAKDIREKGDIIPLLYRSNAIRSLLSSIARDELSDCWEEEHFIINKLEKTGDTHGWHWGDYPYTVIWILEAPAIEHGGILQCIPHTTWDKEDPRVDQYIIDNKISSYFHNTGEVYFLKSDTTLHRVTPMKGDVTRIILNTCWASANDQRTDIQHETMIEAFV